MTVHVSVPSLKRERDVIRSVDLRTKDDLAVLQDLPRGKNQLGHGFPITPAFDALSSFDFAWHVSRIGELTSYVANVTPLTYSDEPTNIVADVIVVNLRYYRAKYAPDSSNAPTAQTHVTLEPYHFFVNEVPSNSLFYTDVYIDNATGLPMRVRSTGADDTSLDIEYGTFEDHWLVKRVRYETTYVGPLRTFRVHSTSDGTFDQFRFPSTPPDPRLAPPSR